MKKAEIIRHAFIDALLTALYVILIASFIYIAGQNSLGENENLSILIPIAMLMLLVFSVALVGWLIFGKPVMWYLDKKKKEALSLLGYTLLFFMLLTLVVLAFLMMIWVV
jgi:hypothetical protein